MSRLYSIIENQINIILRMFFSNDQGQIQQDMLEQYIKPKSLRLVINVLAAFVYLVLLLIAGTYLYNQGLHVMAPSVLAPLGRGKVYQQTNNQYLQLLISLLALMMFF